jgi:hypothetical protein
MGASKNSHERIEGRIDGDVDPADPRNGIITDLALARGAPREAEAA